MQLAQTPKIQLEQGLLKILPKAVLIFNPKKKKRIESKVSNEYISKIESTVYLNDIDLITDIETIYYSAKPDIDIIVKWIYPHQFADMDTFKILFDKHTTEVGKIFKKQHFINEEQKRQMTLFN
jgi:hypothetical protein